MRAAVPMLQAGNRKVRNTREARRLLRDAGAAIKIGARWFTTRRLLWEACPETLDWFPDVMPETDYTAPSSGWHPLPDRLRGSLTELILTVGDRKVARDAGCSRLALVRAALGCDVQAKTLQLIALYLSA